MSADKIPARVEKPDRAPRWQRGLGYIPGRLGRPPGKRAHEFETLEPSTVTWSWPAAFARLYFFMLAARRSVVAV